MKKFIFGAIIAVFTLGFVSLAMKAPVVYAAQSTVNLGTAAPFAVLAGAGITNVPTSVITGNVGLSPATGANYSGLNQAEVTGTIYSVDAFGPGGYVQNPGLLTTAKNDLTTAYVDASGRTPVTTLAGSDNQLGGKTLTPGVYAFSHADGRIGGVARGILGLAVQILHRSLGFAGATRGLGPSIAGHASDGALDLTGEILCRSGNSILIHRFTPCYAPLTTARVR